MYRMVCRVCGIVLGVSVVSASASATSIGTVVDVVNEGYRTPPGASELVARPTDELVSGEGLRTGTESAIHVQFSDGSELSVEAESEILLSDYVFEPVNGAEGTIMLGEGLFHFDSNGAPDGGVELQTPVATIGIRGTEFLVTVSNGATIVDIVDGAVEITPVGGGKAITCEGGQSGLVAASDGDAICGDFGSFSTAAGVPAATSLAQGKVGDNGTDADRPDKSSDGATGGGAAGGGSGGGSSGGGSGGGGTGGGGTGGGGSGGGDPGGGKTNHSGHGDGTNPGKGHDNGNGNGHGNGGGSGGNGGSNNPGGGGK